MIIEFFDMEEDMKFKDCNAEGIKKDTEKEQIEKTKKISIKEGIGYGVSDGFGVRYISPYALALGANNTQIGFLTSLPSLVGNFSQLFTPKLIERTSRKKIAFFGALFQAILWLVVIFIGVLYFIFKVNSNITPTLLVLVYTFLILFGAFYGPAWNSWMKDIVKEKSGKYFGMRNRIVGSVALFSMLIAGFVLDYFKGTKVFFGFIILFGIAFIARSISALLFLRKYEPELVLQKEYYFTFKQFLKKMPQNNFGRFVIFISLMQFATTIASPFFTVYMLKNLGFSYISWMLVITSATLSSLVFMPVWGKFADNYGNVKVVKICSFLIPLIPLAWIFSIYVSKLLIYLIAVEVLSGIFWAGFNLSSSNFIYDAVTRQRMAICVAYFNILQGIGIFIGASLGGIISSAGFAVFGLPALLSLFLISGVLRMIVAIIMSKKIKEVKEVPKFGIHEAKEKFSTLTPGKLWKNLEISLKPR